MEKLFKQMGVVEVFKKDVGEEKVKITDMVAKLPNNKKVEMVEVLLVTFGERAIPYVNPTSKGFEHGDWVIVSLGSQQEGVHNVRAEVAHSFITFVEQMNGLGVLCGIDKEDYGTVELRPIVGYYNKKLNQDMTFVFDTSEKEEQMKSFLMS